MRASSKVLVFLLVAATIFMSRLVIIRLYGSSLPFWDQWDSEGWLLLKPFYEGNFPWQILLSAHNEHRILFSRLITLVVFTLNDRQWDNVVALFANAAIYSALFAFIFVRLTERLNWRSYAPFFALYLVAMCSSVAAENLISGFQNPFFLLAALTVFAVWIAAAYELTARSVFAMVVVAIASVFTIASGLLTAPAIGFAALMRYFAIPSAELPETIDASPTVMRRVRFSGDRRTLMLGTLIFALLIVFAIALMTTPHPPGHAELHAHDFFEFVSAMITALAWPLPGHIWCLPFVWGATAIAAVTLLVRGRANAVDVAAFALAAWIVLQASAVSFSRGHAIQEVSSRYLDLFVLGLLVNAYFAVRLFLGSRRNTGAMLAVSALFALFFVSLCARSVEGAMYMQQRADWSAISTTHVRAFVQTGNMDELTQKPLYHIPYPLADRLAMMLNDPSIRAILPASVRAPLALAPTPGYEADGFYPSTNGDHISNPIGTYTKALGNANRAKFVGPASETPFPFLAFDVAGYLGAPGTSLSVAAANGGPSHPLQPLGFPGEHWMHMIVSTPASPFRVLAEDDNPDYWFAFAGPAEVGRLSMVAYLLLKYAIHLTAAFCLFVGVAIMLVWSRHFAPTPER